VTPAMDSERWCAVRAVFDDLVELEPSARADRLAALAATDPDLRLEVETLLEADTGAEEQLAGLMFGLPASTPSPEVSPDPRRADPLGLTGRTLSHFRVLAPLGSGGMGVVYAAEDTRLGRPVALKLPLPDRRLDSSAKQRFLQEARAAGALDHPNLCSVYEVGESEDGLLFLAMALYRGETLKARLAREGRLDIPEALAIARQIAQGLAAAHQAGIVHRDLKPGNVMLLPDGPVKILDFGLAKARDHSVTGPGTRLGTAAYMAPEQIRDDPVDGRADLWALGVVLYEMLTGRQPFRGEHEVSIAHAIVHEGPPAPSALRAEIPASLEDVILTLLAKAPASRYPSAAAVEAALAGGAPPAGKRRARGHATIAGLLLVLAVLGGYGIRWVRPAAPPASRSLGVLPFENLSPEPANAYFSDGLSEQIMAALSRVDGLRVAARTSSFALRDRRLDVGAIGDILGVEAVLAGSVRQDGRRMRVTVQLIDASTGYHLWSDEFDRELVDIFAVQEEIAGAIAGALELRLPRRGPATAARGVPDLEAYDLYLRGLYLRNTLTADGLRQATDFFDRAIELEPGFARAYAAKASVVAPRIFFRHVPIEQGISDMRAAVARALALDPTLGEAYAALGILRLFFEWDWEGAEQALRRAIELNPSDAHAYHHLANYLRAMGRNDEAVGARERAVELDPLNARTGILLGADYATTGDLDRAMLQYQRALRLDPVNPLALGLGPALPVGPAGVYLSQGRDKEAVEEYVRIAALRGASAGELDSMRGAFARAGMQGFWRSWLDLDLRQSGSTPDPLRIATLWVMIGDTAQALHWLDRAYGERNPGLILLGSGSAFEPLHSHPLVARIRKEMRLPSP
jgi:TolB-like protein